MQIETYLFFEGRCEEALAFYKQALGAETGMVLRYRDNPEPPAQSTIPPGHEDKIMHATFRVGDTVLMASDGRCSGAAQFDGFSLTVAVNSDDEARKSFDALRDGGEAIMPLTRTFFSPAFGMVRDRFGVKWMVLTAQ